MPRLAPDVHACEGGAGDALAFFYHPGQTVEENEDFKLQIEKGGFELTLSRWHSRLRRQQTVRPNRLSRPLLAAPQTGFGHHRKVVKHDPGHPHRRIVDAAELRWRSGPGRSGTVGRAAPALASSRSDRSAAPFPSSRNLHTLGSLCTLSRFASARAKDRSARFHRFRDHPPGAWPGPPALGPRVFRLAAAPPPKANHQPEDATETCLTPRLVTILVTMTTASISDLKANLSRYLRVVRRGGEVQVLDRGTPVARLAPPAANDNEGGRKRLIAKEMLRPSKGSAAAIPDKPPLALPVNLSEALAEDRADRP